MKSGMKGGLGVAVVVLGLAWSGSAVAADALATAPALVAAEEEPVVDGATDVPPLSEQGRSIVCVCEAAPTDSYGAILTPTLALAFLALGLRPARTGHRTGRRRLSGALSGLLGRLRKRPQA